MRTVLAILAMLSLSVITEKHLAAQAGREDPEWVKKSPTVGDMLPDLAVYSADGKEFKTSSLRGHYTVLDFGCLT